MRFRIKVLIFTAALLVSLIGFSLIISPSAPILKVGKDAGYEIIENYLAK